MKISSKINLWYIDWNIIKNYEKKLIKKLEIKVNEKGEIISPTYPELVSKINELIEKVNKESKQD